MGMFLNSKAPYETYKKVIQNPYFVDKTLLLTELMPYFGSINCYCCITRPRRFGKTIMADMIGAFFGRTDSADKIFDDLAISGQEEYKAHLNSHDVIYIDFSRAPKGCRSYAEYIDRIETGIIRDLTAAYEDCGIEADDPVWDALCKIYEQTDNKFVFVLDEWDAVFHMPFISRENQWDYLLFLKWLFKDQPYTEFVYMTGVLPIAKYSSGSELNMFVEYDMASSEKFSEYFGFSDKEVDVLYGIYKKRAGVCKFSREELRIWYDGYYTATGVRLYNPRSVVLALTDGQLRNYWTSSGPYDELFYYIRHNIEAVRDDLAFMVSGGGVPADIGQYTASSMEIDSREQIYSAMVVYGLLTYKDGEVLIPNKELMDKYNELLLSRESLGYVYNLAKKSEHMLQATIAGDTKVMEEILQFAHNTESPIFSYNSETELAAVVNLCYLSARNKYRIEREEKAGKGYVDFIFYPERKNSDCIILELKVDSTPEEAIAQIKDKNYGLRFEGKLGEKTGYTGRVLAVGISYSKETKEHSCRIEVLKTFH
ncbi:MAG: ATP-binding protein [Lachnospiraceae bacterium]|nr:ATP-binding protein [Lachnospiraceae bacterium]